jgi:hypothetical protein
MTIQLHNFDGIYDHIQTQVFYERHILLQCEDTYIENWYKSETKIGLQ